MSFKTYAFELLFILAVGLILACFWVLVFLILIQIETLSWEVQLVRFILWGLTWIFSIDARHRIIFF